MPLASIGEGDIKVVPIRSEGETMTIDINITIGRNGDSKEIGGHEQAPEPNGSVPSKQIDRGPEVEVSHSSEREAVREIYEMIGSKIWVTTCLRERSSSTSTRACSSPSSPSRRRLSALVQGGWR